MARKPDKPLEHVVVQGETLPGIAKRYKFGDWKKIYSDPANSAFRKSTPNPNVLKPGDTVVIPARQVKTETRAGESTNEFVFRGTTSTLKLVVRDIKGAPLKNCYWLLDVNGHAEADVTGEKGEISARVPADFKGEGVLCLWFKPEPVGVSMKMNLRIGHLDPVESVETTKGGDSVTSVVWSGIRARLENLGFRTGDADGPDSPAAASAIKAFQSTYMTERDVSGEPDGRTRGRLIEVHGC